MCLILSDCLIRLTASGRYTTLSLARMAGVSEDTMQRAKQDGSLRHDAFCALARALSAEGEMCLSALTLAPGLDVVPSGVARTDGRIDDEAAGMFAAFGMLVQAFNSRNPQGALQALIEAEAVLRSASAEVARIAT
ncbi:MAG: hypothetical protein IAE99_08025 [Rhodothermales bacterium]|nr:hypothetical protein [Rhodothermales bacterium]